MKTWVVLFIAALVNLALYQNCAPFRGQKGPLELSSSGALGVERFSKAQTALQRNCTSCHAAGQAAGSIPFTFASESQFVSAGLIAPGDIANSKLVYRMVHYGGVGGKVSNMPTSGTLSRADYDAIVEWVTLFGVPEPEPSPGGGQQFMCKTGSDVGQTKMQRLLKNEIKNSLADLIAPIVLASDRTVIINDLATYFVAMPDDQAKPFERFSNSLTPEHIAAHYAIANRFGELVTANATRMNNISGATCMSAASPTKVCVEAFIDLFGSRVFRRPITATEKASFYSFFAARGTTGKKDLIGLLLLSPEFLYRVENQGVFVTGRTDMVRLTGYEIASKISYHYWQSMPNQELFDAARDGKLATSAGIRQVIDAVVFGTQLARTKGVISSYFNEWLKIDTLSPLTNMAPNFKAFTAGENLNQTGYYHRTDMINEMHDLINYEIWVHNGSFNDLLTSDMSFAKTDALAKVYGVPKYTAGGSFVRFPAGQRSGILTRAAMLVTGGVETSPIARGVSVAGDILCNPLPPPSPDVFAMRPNELPPGTATTKDKVHNMTSGPACISCHSVINPLGFAFEQYDAFGRVRASGTQTIYDATGAVIANLPVSPAGDAVISPGTTTPITNAVDLSKKIAESGKAQACFARNYYRYTFRKMENDEEDGCALQAMYNRLDSSGGGMKEMFKEVAVQPAFLIRKFGP